MDTLATKDRRFPEVCGANTRVPCVFALITLLAGSMVGCRICPDTEDMAYPGYGGAWERTVRDRGRVGSLFDPAGARVASLVDKELPPEPDELQRRSDSTDNDDSSDRDMDRDPFGEDTSDLDEPGRKDPMSLDADPDRDSEDTFDEDLERRRKELEELELQDIQVIPGEPLPPIL